MSTSLLSVSFMGLVRSTVVVCLTYRRPPVQSRERVGLARSGVWSTQSPRLVSAGGCSAGLPYPVIVTPDSAILTPEPDGWTVISVSGSSQRQIGDGLSFERAVALAITERSRLRISRPQHPDVGVIRVRGEWRGGYFPDWRSADWRQVAIGDDPVAVALEVMKTV